MVLDLLEGFKEHQLTVIPRKENVVVDALVVSTSVFQVPKYPNMQYKIEVRHRPAIPNNVHHWKVFEDGEQINKFLQMSSEFENIKIDQENMYNKGESAELEPAYLSQLAGKDII